MTWLARVCAILILVFLGLVVWMWKTLEFDPEPKTPHGINSPILGIELARSAREVRSVFRDPMGCHNRAELRESIDKDWYFIAIYSLLLSGLGAIAAFRPGVRWRLTAVLVLLLAGTAAYFDVVENRRILAMTATESLGLHDQAAQATRHASLIKWAFFFGALLPIAMIFLLDGSGGRRSRRLVGGLFLVAAVVGIYGLVDNPWIGLGGILFGLALLPTFVVTSFWPEVLASPAGDGDAERAGQGRLPS